MQVVVPLQKDNESFPGLASDFYTSKPTAVASAAASRTPPRSPGLKGSAASRSPTLSAEGAAAALEAEEAEANALAAKEAARMRETGGKLKIKYVKDKRAAAKGAGGRFGLCVGLCGHEQSATFCC